MITPLRNNNASISAIKLQSGALAIIYNDVSFNEDGSRTVWPDQRCPVAMAISEDGGKTWPWRRIVEHGEGARALRIIPKCPATVDNLHDCPAVFAAGHFW